MVTNASLALSHVLLAYETAFTISSRTPQSLFSRLNTATVYFKNSKFSKLIPLLPSDTHFFQSFQKEFFFWITVTKCLSPYYWSSCHKAEEILKVVWFLYNFPIKKDPFFLLYWQNKIDCSTDNNSTIIYLKNQRRHACLWAQNTRDLSNIFMAPPEEMRELKTYLVISL